MKLHLCLALMTAILLGRVLETDAKADQIVRILFTNNSNGKLVNCNCPNDPYGGLAERVSFIRSYRERYNDILLLDSGGYLGLSDIERKGALVLKLMGIMGYDIWGIGDQELYYGLGKFLDRFGGYSENIINASLYSSENKRVFTEQRIMTVHGIRFGILGLMSNETVKFFPKGNQDFIIEDPDSTLNRLLPELKSTSDFIIVLSQMGREKDEETAKKWPDIDLIIGGHSQTLLKKALHISNCRIVQAGKGGGRIGEINLTFDSANNLKDFTYKLIEVTEKYPIPPDIKKLLERTSKADRI